ncbi:hypothetical protein ANCDUO_25407, partial [Ancylostoma duodenale]
MKEYTTIENINQFGPDANKERNLVRIKVKVVAFDKVHLKAKRQELKRLNAEWQIPHTCLIQAQKSDRKSRRSLQSGPSTLTGDSTFDPEISKFELYVLNKEPVLVTKHSPVLIASSERELFVK